MLYPLKFKPALKEKVWGGHKLEPLLQLPQTERKIGEAWLVWDGLAVVDGPLQGRTIRDLTHEYGEQLLGRQSKDAADFPLLMPKKPAGFVHGFPSARTVIHPPTHWRHRQDAEMIEPVLSRRKPLLPPQ